MRLLKFYTSLLLIVLSTITIWTFYQVNQYRLFHRHIKNLFRGGISRLYRGQSIDVSCNMFYFMYNRVGSTLTIYGVRKGNNHESAW